MKRVLKHRSLCVILILFIAFILTGKEVSAEENSFEYDGGPIKIIYDFLGHYSLNYTGNTNHYDYWNANGTTKIVSRNYKDRSDISSANNSSASVNPTDDVSTVKKAYLIWESRAENAPTEEIGVITPTGVRKKVVAQWVCQDTRTNAIGEEYVGVYTMVTDVTEIVCSEYGGYGTYTVVNIPVWEGTRDGVTCGGESVASWQLVIVEESPNFPLRTISMNVLSQYFYNIDYTVTVNFADASSPNGTISAQFLDGTVDVDSAYRYDGIGYPDDYNYKYEGNYYRYFTPTRGLYKNGVCFNNRDIGTANSTGSSTLGGIRVHQFDDFRRLNNSISHSTRYLWAGKNMGINVFLYGVSIDVFAYDIVFDGNGASTGSMENLTCIYGRGYNLPKNQFCKEHYKFTGWNTEPDGSGIRFRDGKYVRNLTATEAKVILYAQWLPNTYEITLDNREAVFSGTKNYYEWYGVGNYSSFGCETEIAKIDIPEKKGYIFAGYYTKENGAGIQYVDENGNILSSPTIFEQDTTLYAKWLPEVYKITLDNQNADTSGTKEYYQKYAVGNYTATGCTVRIAKIENPTKAHHTFAGYYTEKNGEGQCIIDADGNIAEVYTLFVEDTTLYAYWKPNTYIISLDSQNAAKSGTEVYYEEYGVRNYYIVGVVDTELKEVVQQYDYTGRVQIFIAPHTGTYRLDVYGASGENNSAYIGVAEEYTSYGGWVYGTVNLREGDILYIYVGEKGIEEIGGWNGGGDGTTTRTDNVWSYTNTLGGGGATDIRKDGTELEDRIIVAGGGAGNWYRIKINGSLNSVDEIFPQGGGEVTYFQINTFDYYSIDENLQIESANQLEATNYSEGEVLFSAKKLEDGLDYDFLVKYAENGTFGYGAGGGGGGWYGGGMLEIAASHIDDNGTQMGGTYLGGTSSGSSYKGGVINGRSFHTGTNGDSVYYYDSDNYIAKDSVGNSIKATAGNGYAKISYMNYKMTSKTPATSITVPQRQGYTFGGYYTEKGGKGTQYVDESGNILSSSTTFEKDTTLYAYWIASDVDIYQIAFNGNGADSGKMAIMTCNFNTNYMLTTNAFTKIGYTFSGWSTTADGEVKYADEAVVNNLVATEGEVATLYAQWIPDEVSYKINHYTENLHYGWSLHSTDEKTGTTGSRIELDEYVKILNGFSYSHAEVKGVITAHTTILADGSLIINLYYARNLYTVMLEKDIGILSVSGEGIYKYEEVVKISAVVSSGYTWYGWSGTRVSTECTYEFFMPAEDATMKANTSPFIYTIYLENEQATEDGTLEYYEKYGVGNYAESACVSEIAAIKLPKKTGYYFNGYYSGEEGTGIQYVDTNGNILSTSTTFTEDTVLYAYWTPLTYIIRFEGNGATGGSMSDMVCTYGELYQLSKNQFTRVHYKFVGWNTEADGSGCSYIDRSYVENLLTEQNSVVVLYAQWSPNTYAVHFDANGGSGTMESVVLTFGVPQSIPVNAFTKDNEYGNSTFLGWNTRADATVALYEDGAKVVDILGCESGSVTLFAIWDDCPWILAEDLYYSLDEAQSGFITYDELMNQAVAEDLEDGSPLLPGIDEEKGISFTITDYLSTDFTQFTSDGSVTETYQVIDSAGNEFKKRITVHIVDTTAVVEKPLGTTRFISEKYYNAPCENGGLEEDSIWKTDLEYVAIIQKAFENSRNDTPIMSFVFSYEDILQMKKFIEINGIGNTKSKDALQRFYDEFLISAHTN